MIGYVIDKCKKCGEKHVLVTHGVEEEDLVEMNLNSSEIKSVFIWRCHGCKTINKLTAGVLHGPGADDWKD